MRELNHWRTTHTGIRTAPVLIVSKAVAPHTVIDSTDVTVQQVDVSAVQPAAISQVSDVVGQYAATQWLPGQQVIAGMMVDSTAPAAFPLSIPSGERALTVPDDAVTGVDHFISPGDHVDVLVMYTDKTEGGPDAKTLLQNLLVLAADNSPTLGNTATAGSATVSGSASSSSQSGRTDTLTLAVTPQQAVTLAFGSQFGQIHIDLRNPKDKAVATTSTMTAVQAAR